MPSAPGGAGHGGGSEIATLKRAGVTRPSVTDDEAATIELPASWTETRFERGAFGPDDRSGFEATFERADASLSVLPVRYGRSDGRERIRALTGEYRATREDLTSERSVPATTAFAARATFAPYEREHRAVVCVAADAGDALAAAVWLAAGSDDARDLGRNVRLHAGTRPASRSDPALADDDVLAARFAEVPGRCLFTGTETRSHRIEVPYRYAPLLDGVGETARGVPRFPSTVRRLVGVVSHRAWTERDLDDVGFDTALERISAGRYRLDEAAVETLAGADAGRLALARLGEE